MRGVLLTLAACAQAGRPTVGDQIDAPVGDAKHADAHIADAPASTSCASGATCQAGQDLGTVSGDSGAAMVNAMGYQSAWYHVRVTEDDSGPFAVAMSMTATLTSPAGFGVYVYVNTGSDVVECTTAATGPTNTIRIVWGETGTFANGNDDSRSVSIEVRAPATGCSAAQQWHLVVQGDT